MTVDKQKLRVLASKATPGPWTYDRNAGCRAIKGNKAGRHPQAQYTEIAVTVGLHDDARDAANAAFIAAVSPSTVLALLGEIERLRDLATKAVAIGVTALSDEGHDRDECESWVRLQAIRKEVIRG